MRYFLIILTGILLTITSSGQTLTAVYFPSYMQGVGSSGPNTHKVPYACRFSITGLTPNATYHYINHFVRLRTTATGDGASIFIRANGNFERIEQPSFATPDAYGEFTADASGVYTGWFINEANQTSTFNSGTSVFFRIALNDGNGGISTATRLTTTAKVNIIDFDATATAGTAIRSTPAASGVAKNFVLLFGSTSPAPGESPITGTFIESDGTDNSVANGYADFYATNVNTVSKTWGAIIPNNLANGVRKIAQYSITDGSELGTKTSADGSWAQAGGGTVSTVTTSGGLLNVIVLDGAVITLGVPVTLPQTITFSPLPVNTYGDADLSPGATASSSLAVIYTSDNPAVATIVNGNSIHIVGAGTANITANQAGNTDYNPAPPVTQAFMVNKASLTITADNQTKVQGDPLPAFTASYAGFVNGESAAVLLTQPTVVTTATPASPAGQYPITASGADAANYTISYVEGKLTVTSNKQSQTISFNTIAAKRYGNIDFSPGATSTSGLTVAYASSDPAVATIVNGMIHITGIGTSTITASQAGDLNYEAAINAMQVLTVTKAPLTVQADNKTKLVGQTNPPLTITYTGFVYNENNTLFTAQPVISTTAVTASPAGNYPITITGAVAANYDITHVNGTLVVSPLPAQTISFAEFPVKKYGDGNFSISATASSGLPVTYASNNTQVAVIQSGTVQIIGAGTAVITASQAGDATHAAAADVARTLTVQKANLLIQASDTSKLEGQANPLLQVLYTGFVKGENATALTTQPVVSTVATTTSVAGNYVISVSGASSSNYAIAQAGGTLRILPVQGANQDNLTAWISAPGQLQINIHSVEAGKATVQLFDQQGTRLQQINFTLAAGFNTHRLPVGNLVAGIYYVRVSGPGFMLKNKLVIR